MTETQDPLIGKVLGDRFEITELLSVGGMARLYLAVQRSLERKVVVKFIHTDLLTADEITAEEASARFFVEAQAASRLNHPNVVGIYDFGRTPASEGGHLFLVMEHLAGRDLWTVLANDPPMPIPRIVGILKQILAALGEAHYLGITHRDVKPENIVLEQRRGGVDRVKVIDFGLARVGAMKSVTKAGRTVGTPHYMAPEQVQGQALGSGDLYSVGVILFEMLTGRVPFEGDNTVEILHKHLSAPRPDPRAVAPDRNIPAALALMCMRSISADPKQRYESAEEMASALSRAAGTDERASRPSHRPAAPSDPGEAEEAPPPSEVPLVGRSADVVWANRLLEDAGAGAFALLCGREGMGRTRMLVEIARMATARGMHVVRVTASPAPRHEIGYGGLRRLVPPLLGLPADDPALAAGLRTAPAYAGRAAPGPRAATGLRAIFSGDLPAGPSGPVEARRGAAEALAWSVRHALVAARGKLVVLVDDADRLDNASGAALDALFEGAAVPGLVAIATRAHVPEKVPDAIRLRTLAGLSLEEGARLLVARGGAALPTSRRRDADLEPLYLELVARWRPREASAANLRELVAWRILNLPAAQRRLLQAVAVTGGGTLDELSAMLRRGDLDRALDPLLEDGLLAVDAEEGLWVAHAVFGRITLGLAPAGVAAEMHRVAAEQLAKRPELVEARAWHAVRGKPDFDAFLFVEEAAAIRSMRGDDAGAALLLNEGLQAGRTLLLRGEIEEGGSACVVFGRKLGAALLALGRLDEATGVLEEVLPLTPPHDATRAKLCELLAACADKRGRAGEAARWRTEASAATPRPRR